MVLLVSWLFGSLKILQKMIQHLLNKMKFCLKIEEKSRSAGIWEGLGGLSEAILNDIGSKLACLGSCWCYVEHFGQQDGCQHGYLGDQEWHDEPRWRPRVQN